MPTIERYWFFLILYSVLGWVYETILCSVDQKRFVNRGFLNGPYCPIYGFGALFDEIILGKIENPLLLFILGALLCCTLEYVTSYVMEVIFHARWWDYSEHKFNLNGRICLLGAVVFGILSAFVVKIAHPFVENFTNNIPSVPFHIITALSFILFAADCIVTVRGFQGFNGILKELAETLDQAEENIKTRIQGSSAFEAVGSIYANFSKKLSAQQHRMLSAFPRLKSVHNNHILMNLRNYIDKKRTKR